MDKKLIYIGGALILVFVVGLSVALLSQGPEIRPSPPMAFHYCKDASDCVPVGCSCNCSGCGGFSYDDIVNKETVDDWYALEGCQPVDACPEVCCKPKEIVCENNQCSAKDLSTCGDGICASGETNDCPEDCGEDAEPEGIPICKLVGSKSEGWYDSVSGNRIKWDNCANCTSILKVEPMSAWFSNCGGLIMDANKSPNCILEGEEYIPLETLGGPECCPGLEAIKGSSNEKDLCSQCGNNNCEPWEDSANCPEDCKVSDEYLEIHEWGVLAGCESNDTYFATNRPEIMMSVFLPVVYVHSRGIDSLDAEFTFSTGEPTDVYPGTVNELSISGCAGCPAMFGWQDVKIGREEEPQALGAYGAPRVPFEDILPTLSDVDSDDLSYEGTNSKFLFYEGDLEYDNEVSVEYNITEGTATFTNNGAYPVHNVILAHQEGDFMNSRYYQFLAGDLLSGAEKTVTLPTYDPDDPAIYQMKSESFLEQDMISIGFTEKETEAFVEIWEAPMFSPTNLGFTHLIYRLPQSKYDELLPAKITPEPDEFVRTMYVLVEL